MLISRCTFNNFCRTSLAVGLCWGWVAWHLFITIRSLLFAKLLPSTSPRILSTTGGIFQMSTFSSYVGFTSDLKLGTDSLKGHLCSGATNGRNSFLLPHNIPFSSLAFGVLSSSFKTMWKSSVIRYCVSNLRREAESHITWIPIGLLCR